MPLAAIFGLCALLTSPGAMHLAQPTVLLQETQPQQPSSQPGPAQSPEQQTTPEPSKPEAQATPEPAKPEPQTTPEQQAKPEQPTAPDSTQPPENVQPNAEKPDCGASKGKKRNSKRKAPAQAATGPRKTVVRNGSTADPVVQLAPSVTDQQASQQRQSTAQLLAATDANLTKISARQLTSSQQDMVNQIRNYMQQAKTAETAGDLQRARNLAFKAQLLSDEVLRH
jgi:hypothetical protein